MSAPHRSPLWPGAPMALASAVLFGVSAPLSKLLLGQVAPQLLAGLLYLGAGSGLAILIALRALAGRPSGEAPLRRADAPRLAVAIALGGVAAPLLLMLGLSRTDASTGSLLLNLEGLATMGIAWLAFRENVDRRLLLGAAAILAGAILLSWQGAGLAFNAGAALVAAACLCWGVDNNVTRTISAADPAMITMVKGLVAGTVNVASALAIGVGAPPLATVGAAMLLGLFAIGFSLMLFIGALRHLGAARTSAYFTLAPFIGAAVAVVLLGEPATARLFVAAALMGFGLWLHLAERHEHEHVHEPLEHDHLHVHDAHHRHRHDGPTTEPHAHPHRHAPLQHAHPHYPDLHHRHRHG